MDWEFCVKNEEGGGVKNRNLGSGQRGERENKVNVTFREKSKSWKYGGGRRWLNEQRVLLPFNWNVCAHGLKFNEIKKE